MTLLLWVLGCADPPDDVVLYAEGDGALCLDAEGTTLSIDKDCAITCAESEWQGSCEALIVDDVELPGTTPSRGMAVVVRSEILVKQAQGCPPTVCESVRISCPMPADTQGLAVIWGDDDWASVGDLPTCPELTVPGDTGAR